MAQGKVKKKKMISHPAEESRYTTQVQLWHQQLAPTIPIESFVEYLDADMLGLENRAQFYAPVEFAVHVRGPISGPAGAVRLHVPVHANEDWLPILEHRIGAMFGVDEDADVELKTLSGRSLDTFSPDELASVGKLNVFIDGQRARMHELPQVPMEYSINKMDSIHAWFHAVKEDLPEMLAQEMMHKSAAEMNAAIAPGGAVEHLIKTHLRESTTDWNEFVRVNHMNSPAYLEEEGSDALLDHIAGSIRSTLRSFVESSADDISTYLQSVEAERVAQQLRADGKDTDEYKPIFGNTNLQVKVSADDGFDMYHGIMESLFDLPTVETEVVNAIYTKPIAGCRWEKEPPRYGDAPLRLGTNAIALLKQIENAKTQAELKRIMDDNYMQLNQAAVALYFVRAENMSDGSAPDLNKATLERMARISGLRVSKTSKTIIDTLFGFFDKKNDKFKADKPAEQSWTDYFASWVPTFGLFAQKPSKPAPRTTTTPVPQRQNNIDMQTRNRVFQNTITDRKTTLRDIENLLQESGSMFTEPTIRVYMQRAEEFFNAGDIPSKPDDDTLEFLLDAASIDPIPDVDGWTLLQSKYWTQKEEVGPEWLEAFRQAIDNARTQSDLKQLVDNNIAYLNTSNAIAYLERTTALGGNPPVPLKAVVDKLYKVLPIVDQNGTVAQRFKHARVTWGGADEEFVPDDDGGSSSDEESDVVSEDDVDDREFRSAQDLEKMIFTGEGSRQKNIDLLVQEGIAIDQEDAKSKLKNYIGNATKSRMLTLLQEKYRINSTIETHHPWNAQIHHTLKEVAGGVYPEYYTDRHMHEDMTQNAEYAGDVGKTYDAYHLFANAHPMPAGVKINAPVDLVPIECHAKKDEKKKKKKKKNRPMRSAMGDDDLVPVANDYYETLDELVPIMPVESNTDEAPPIVPIACHGNKKYQSDDDDEEDEGRMGSEIPPRPPTISLAKAAAMRKNLVRVEQKHGFSGLPEVDDFF